MPDDTTKAALLMQMGFFKVGLDACINWDGKEDPLCWINIAGSYANPCGSVKQDLAIAEAQLRDYQVRLSAPFTHDAYLSQLTDLRDQLKAGLSAHAPAGEGEAGPTVPELAERIKALKAAHTIEITPGRIGNRRASNLTSRCLLAGCGRGTVQFQKVGLASFLLFAGYVQ